MASNTSFSYSQTFTDLLNQTNSQVPPLFSTQQNTPPDQTNFQVPPLFSTQPNTPPELFHTQNVPAQTVEENTPDTNGEGRRRWTVTEDGVLVSAWLNTSKDAIVGTDQKAGAFWKRVALYYAASPAVKDLPKRQWNTCKQRWAKINEGVLKFCGCYEAAQRQRSSGQSEDDLFHMAYNFYSQDQGNSFTLEHAWRVLRHDQKWCSLISQKNKSHSKRVRLDESGKNSPTSNTVGDMEDQTMVRPIGVKAAKSKGKRCVKEPNEERAASLKALESVWMIKEKDNEVKERLSKQKILDRLLGLTEPLSEIEITLKNKLISEMLSN